MKKIELNTMYTINAGTCSHQDGTYVGLSILVPGFAAGLFAAGLIWMANDCPAIF